MRFRVNKLTALLETPMGVLRGVLKPNQARLAVALRGVALVVVQAKLRDGATMTITK
jgi:hypothetical protein